ncbi:hypothetical protein B0H14DRAFT_3549313 [Mycena olivaceomarginata]|nr:hypothetical protein B0H14DRAFT_3549313 [Mycena olivaceomarginata]
MHDASLAGLAVRARSPPLDGDDEAHSAALPQATSRLLRSTDELKKGDTGPSPFVPSGGTNTQGVRGSTGCPSAPPGFRCSGPCASPRTPPFATHTSAPAARPLTKTPFCGCTPGRLPHPERRLGGPLHWHLPASWQPDPSGRYPSSPAGRQAPASCLPLLTTRRAAAPRWPTFLQHVELPLRVCLSTLRVKRLLRVCPTRPQHVKQRLRGGASRVSIFFKFFLDAGIALSFARAVQIIVLHPNR